MTDARNAESWQAARALVRRYGLEEAHAYAFARGHEYPSFSPFATPETRLEWRRIAGRIRWLYDELQDQLAAAQARHRDRLRPLNTRREW